MSSPHLGHLIKWDQLSSLLVDQNDDDDDGIELPVDEDGRIHLTSRAVEIMIQRRKYLHHRICRDNNCMIVGSCLFHKRRKKSKTSRFVGMMKCRTQEQHTSLRWFLDRLTKTIHEFCATQLRKATEATMISSSTSTQRAKKEILATEILRQEENSSSWDILYDLISRGDVRTILILQESNRLAIRELLQQNFGGQAIGNGFVFLVVYHLLPFYLACNIIIITKNNIQSHEENLWDSLFTFDDDGMVCHNGRSLGRDCDGRTFLEHLRPALRQGVFMRDYETTHNLIKQVFDAIIAYYVVCHIAGCERNVTDDVLSGLGIAFRWKGFSSFRSSFFDDEDEAYRKIPLCDIYCTETLS